MFMTEQYLAVFFSVFGRKYKTCQPMRCTVQDLLLKSIELYG